MFRNRIDKLGCLERMKNSYKNLSNKIKGLSPVIVCY